MEKNPASWLFATENTLFRYLILAIINGLLMMIRAQTLEEWAPTKMQMASCLS